MKALIAKLTNLKQEWPLACSERDIRILKYLHNRYDTDSAKFRPNLFYFFYDGWIELVELHKKKYVSDFQTKVKKNFMKVRFLDLILLI